MQLVKSQREAAQLRDDRRKFLSSVREKEEALEQAMEQERRAQAEVENLRGALDESMEIATFTQTELEDLKRTSEETTRHLYEDLEEAQSELALLTPIRSVSACSTGGGRGGGEDEDGVDGGRRSIEGGGRRPRRFFRMASFEEEGEEEEEAEEEGRRRGEEAEGGDGGGDSDLDAYGTPNAKGDDDEQVSPILPASTGGRPGTGGVGDCDGVAEEEREAYFGGQAAKLQQDLEQQLRLNAASTPQHSAITPTAIPDSQGTAIDGVDSCSSYRTTNNLGHRNSSGGGSSLEESGCGRPPSLALFDDVGRDRAETIVGGSAAVVVVSSADTATLGGSRGGGGGSGGGGVSDGVSSGSASDSSDSGSTGRVYDAWDDDDDDSAHGDGAGKGRGGAKSSRRTGECSGCGGCESIGEVMEALSNWRPFGWCYPASPGRTAV
eukprot:jgi/Undpi1/5839/HiC_scaffold_2.g01113.m1